MSGRSWSFGSARGGGGFGLEAVLWTSLAIAVVLGGGWWWWDSRRHVTTDNAYVDADITLLSSQVSGFVVQLLVAQNDAVRPGQPVALIDPAEFRLRLASALAKRREARAALVQRGHRSGERDATLAEKVAALRGVQAVDESARSERGRIAQLAAGGWVTSRLLQTTTADAAKAAAAVQEARAGIAAEAARRQTVSAEAETLAAALAGADAEVARARLDLARTVLRAPVRGTIGPLVARIGEFVKPGDVVLHIVPSRTYFVVANFKETQVGRLHVDQVAHITLDAFPEQRFAGRIQSLSPATGSRFAAMPIDTANGNFVKVVQRLPVRIALIATSVEASRMVRPGLSATVAIDLDD